MTWLDFPAWIPNKKQHISTISIQKKQCFPHKWVTNTQLYLPHKWLAPQGSPFGFSHNFLDLFGDLNLWAESLRIRFGSGCHWITKNSAPVENAANKILSFQSTWNIQFPLSFSLQTNKTSPTPGDFSGRDRPFYRLPDERVTNRPCPKKRSRKFLAIKTSHHKRLPTKQWTQYIPTHTTYKGYIYGLFTYIWMVNLYGKLVRYMLEIVPLTVFICFYGIFPKPHRSKSRLPDSL